MKDLILDTSTLILLAKIGLLEPLAEHVSITIPESVREEAVKKQELADAKAIYRFIQEKKIRVASERPPEWIQTLAEDFRLGEGECEAIALAKSRGALLGVDDGLAIKACKALGVSFVTALAFVARFYERDLLTREQAFAKLEKLKKYGWYHEGLLEKVAVEIKRGEKK